MEKITFVLTSCNRPELLEKTLDSFFKFNTYPIKRYIVIDDSGKVGCNDFLKEKYPSIEFIYNEKNIGQIKSVDKAYKMVKTPWIFHCEDDWEFYHTGFIEESFNILMAYPRVITVWLRALNDTNSHPFTDEVYKAGVATRFRIMRFGFMHDKLYEWHGFTFNPGLRRTSDWEKFGNYSDYEVLIEGQVLKNTEATISIFCAKMGYVAVILNNNDNGYVKHIGWEHSTSKKFSR